MHIDRYLERIGVGGPIRPDLETLRRLHRAHLMAIPFENLDVQLGRPVSMDIPAIIEKIVGRKRGGWCYEMNGIFGWVLKELGFDVHRATGAVMRETNGAASEGNHLVLNVSLDEDIYLADVGFGDGPFEPLPVSAGRFSARGFDYEIECADDPWWRLRHQTTDEEWSFDFNPAPADEALLAAKCSWLQTSPHSPFIQNVVCQRQTQSGITVLRGRVLRHVTPQGASQRLLADANDFMSVLADEFALELPEAASLWPKICARHEQIFSTRNDEP